MRILFFPSDLGGGYGHFSRCIALAYEAMDRGHFCAFVLNDNKFIGRVSSKFPVSVVKPWQPLRRRILTLISYLKNRKNSKTPLYVGFSGIEFQVIRDGFFSSRAIEHTLWGYKSAVQKFKPDVLVGDTNLLVWMLSGIVGIPAVQIVRYATHPETANLVWWRDMPEGISPPDTVKIFNPLLKRLGLNAIGSGKDLLRGDFYIVPSTPEIEPIPQGLTDTSHVGALLMRADLNTVNPAVGFSEQGMPLIYVTIGGGAGSVGNLKLFSSIVSAMGDYPAQVIISTGGKFDLKNIPCLPTNIRVFDWLPGGRIISMADLVIFHGGYGTMMETVAAAKPSIIIPFHAEQESNGRRLEQLGCARILKLSKEPYSSVKIKEPWGEYSYVVQRSYDLTDEELVEAVVAIIYGREFSEAAKKLQHTVREYGGAEFAMELIESRFG